jgi:asparagine synthase (glutamine-hydrolysing)
MCGIAGYVAKSQLGVPSTIIEEMTRVIAHRGPDGAGQFYCDNFALGHRRLAIIELRDLSTNS